MGGHPPTVSGTTVMWINMGHIWSLLMSSIQRRECSNAESSALEAFMLCYVILQYLGHHASLEEVNFSKFFTWGRQMLLAQQLGHSGRNQSAPETRPVKKMLHASLAAGWWLNPATQSFLPSATVPSTEKYATRFMSDVKRFSSIRTTHLASLSSQTKCHSKLKLLS